MPVILPAAGQPLWLDSAIRDPEILHALLTPIADAELVAWEVGRAVNNPRNDGPQLAEPVVSAPAPQQRSLL